ncbi:bifunctional serine/threonine-protein kinase/phosphatase [Bosea beijingensis]
MSPSRLVLQVPSEPGRHIALPFFSSPPNAVGRKLPNGMIIVTDEAHSSLFYKFTPWRRSLLASNEIDIYSRLEDLDDLSGVVRLVGVSGTKDHLVRIVERSRKGSLNSFLFDEARGDHRSIDARLVRSILAQIAQTMNEIHGLNLVHRDLKAENILVFDDDADVRDWQTVRAKVSDFDRTVELPRGERLENPVGSLFHMAPELLAREKYDRKVDVYAFGILMFEAAHGGARAYANVATSMPGSISKEEFAKKVVDEEFRPCWLHDDEALKHLATRCWASNPDKRPEFSEIFESLKPASPWPASLDRRGIAKPHQDGGLDGVGIASDLGKARRSMEDAACVLQTPDALVAGVFDGVRGDRASELAARQFAITLVDQIAKNSGDAKAAMRTTLGIVDSTLRELEPPIQGGSTAIVALLREEDLLVAWLGDSPAYLFRKADAGAEIAVVSLVNKHLPSRDDEAIRIAANGGVVDREKRWLDNGEAAPWGPLRVFVPNSGQSGGIALSRALGLFSFKPAIGDDPEMIRLERQDDDLFLVLGSDGVFDVLDTQAVAKLVAAASSAQHAADTIIDAVLKNGAPDNASIIVADLRIDGSRNSCSTAIGRISR